MMRTIQIPERISGSILPRNTRSTIVHSQISVAKAKELTTSELSVLTGNSITHTQDILSKAVSTGRNWLPSNDCTNSDPVTGRCRGCIK